MFIGGGDFATGFQAGAYNQLYNGALHEMKKMAANAWESLDFEFNINIGHLNLSTGADPIKLDLLPSFGGGASVAYIRPPDVRESASIALSKRTQMSFNENSISFGRSYSWPDWPVNYTWSVKKRITR